MACLPHGVVIVTALVSAPMVPKVLGSPGLGLPWERSESGGPAWARVVETGGAGGEGANKVAPPSLVPEVRAPGRF